MNINLIFGNRKSGTTLLARLIDSEHIYVGSSETNFHHFGEVKFLTNNEFSYEDIEKFFPSELHANEILLDKKKYKKIIMEGVRDIKSYHDFIILHLEALMKGSNCNTNEKKAFFIKNVGEEPKKAITNFLKAFPKSKIISITRDPRYILKAIINDRKKNNRSLSYAQKLRYAFEAHRSVKQQIALKEHDQIYTVKYEDLKNNHINEIKNILHFCKLPFSETNQIVSINGKETNTATHSLESKKGEVNFSSSKLYENLNLVDFIVISFSKFIFVTIGLYIFFKKLIKLD